MMNTRKQIILLWLGVVLIGVAGWLWAASLFSESFEGTGYENSGWDEAVGANESNLVNEDSAVTPPAGIGLGTQCLNVVKDATPTATAAASTARTYRDLSGEAAITYTSFYIQVATGSLATLSTEVDAARGLDSSVAVVWHLAVRHLAAGTYKFQMYLFNNGLDANLGNWPVSGDISFDTWYKIRMKYDKTNNLYDYQINDASIYSGSLTGTLKTGILRYMIGDNFNVAAASWYIDGLKSDSVNWPTYTAPSGWTNMPASRIFIMSPYLQR